MNLSRLTQAPIRMYQRYISRDYNADRNAHCMYYPSCSAYVKQAVEVDGPVRGIAEGSMRLLRCTSEVHRRHLAAFARQVTAHPGSALVRAEGEGAAAALREMEKSGRLDEHFLVVTLDPPPGSPPAADEALFVVRPVEERPSQVAGQLAPIQQALIGSAGAIGAVLGAAVGALVGIVVGLPVGARLGAAAGGLGGERLALHVADQYSPDSLLGVRRLEMAVGKAGHATHEFLEKHHAGALAGVLGPVVGIVSGALAGLAGGLWMAGGAGADMGRALGRNWTADLCGVLHEPQGCCCAQCQQQTEGAKS